MNIKKILTSVSILVPLFVFSEEGCAFRCPAYPLAVNNPALSLWSATDELNASDPVHWTGDRQPLRLIAKIGERRYRLCGAAQDRVDEPAALQTSVKVSATQTRYRFEVEDKPVEVCFSTATLPEFPEVMSRPVTYITVTGCESELTISPAFATDNDAVPMMTNRVRIAGCEAVTIERRMMNYPTPTNVADRVRADYGRVWLVTIAPGEWLLAFDDIFSVRLLGERQRPYWARGGGSFETMLEAAVHERRDLLEKMDAFDRDFRRRAATFGKEYADLAELVWRQTWGGTLLCADDKGKLLRFTRENTSNGCIGTIDILYPMLPALMLAGPDFLRATIEPVVRYAESKFWPFAFAPHDLGVYPLADGQAYAWDYKKDPTGEKADVGKMMPVEECGNMLIAFALLAQMDGDAGYFLRHRPLVEKWAEYLAKSGFDPEDQLCTDDFAGHLAHNANLSIKSIVAYGAYAKLLDMIGEKTAAAEWRALAEESVAKWLQAARDGVDSATRLAFDQPDTWSLKYNLAADRLLGLGLFPAQLVRSELEHYRAVAARYGTPLDSRMRDVKVDWLVWCAALTETQTEFESFIKPFHSAMSRTPDRYPCFDLYNGDTLMGPRYGKPGRRFVGFNSRPVIGGIYMPLVTKHR